MKEEMSRSAFIHGNSDATHFARSDFDLHSFVDGLISFVSVLNVELLHAAPTYDTYFPNPWELTTT